MTKTEIAPERVNAQPRFVFRDVTCEGRKIRMSYRFVDRDDVALDFVEEIILPEMLPAPNPEEGTTKALLQGMLFAFGVSYYKACIPCEIVAETVSPADAQFWASIYTQGLAEFYFRNDIDPGTFTGFPIGDDRSTGSEGAALDGIAQDGSALLLVGGGKDSLTAKEAVSGCATKMAAFSMNTAEFIERSAESMGLDHLVAKRSLDAELFRLNDAGAPNGHVPISACIAFLSVLCAHLGGYRAVIAANESSANEPTMPLWNGVEVNHQWSKGLDFERAFRAWCSRNAPESPVYFSALRQASEMLIVKKFCRHYEHHQHFASCNGNFKIRKDSPLARWCGRCPKCVFVQLLFAAELPPAEVRSIFAGDFLQQPANAPILRSLVGLTSQKPFECVGTIVECRAAFRLYMQDVSNPPAHLVEIERDLSATAGEIDDDQLNALYTLEGEHLIPEFWKSTIDEYLRT